MSAYACTVDDGTGAIVCVRWYNSEPVPNVALGALVTVYGKVVVYRGMLQLRVYKICILGQPVRLSMCVFVTLSTYVLYVHTHTDTPTLTHPMLMLTHPTLYTVYCLCVLSVHVFLSSWSQFLRRTPMQKCST